MFVCLFLCFTGIVVCEAPNNKLDKFTGVLSWKESKHSLSNEKIILRGCVLRNTSWCFGMVIFAGTADSPRSVMGEPFLRSLWSQPLALQAGWTRCSYCMQGALLGWMQSAGYQRKTLLLSNLSGSTVWGTSDVINFLSAWTLITQWMLDTV